MKKTLFWIVAILSVATLAWCDVSVNSTTNLEDELGRMQACADKVWSYLNTDDYEISWDDESEGWASFIRNWHIIYTSDWDTNENDFQCIVDMVDQSINIQFLEYIDNEGQEWEENIDTILPEWAKTALTDEELEEIIDTHFPKWYDFSVYNTETEVVTDWSYTYPEDLDHSLLLPIHATMASREILSSGIEDGMIYTDTKVTLQDGTEVSVLYIVNPETLDFVAANVENGNEITNYQFVY